jgi:surfeit locus 1 family protein
MKAITLHVSGGLFVFRLVPTVTALIMLVVLVGLGSWQVERLHWKQNLIATIADRMRQPPVDVEAFSANPEEADYRPASAQGEFDHDHIFYLAAISLTGEGGYHLLTPLRLANGRYLLVDRGWIPYDHKNHPEGFARPKGPVALTGILRLPRHALMQPANRPASNDWYWIDLTQMAVLADIPGFLPYILSVNAAPDSAALPIGGQTRLELPNNHLQYVLTWYGLAMALTIIYMVYSFQRIKKP